MHCCTDRINMLGAFHGTEANTDRPEPGEEVITAIRDAGIPAPRIVADRGTEGRGPFNRLLIKDVMIIDGTGRKPYGPASVVIEKDRIVAISTDNAGESPSLTREADAGGRGSEVEIIDGAGLTLLPGFIESHAHFDSLIPVHYGTLTDPQYILKLWLSHGITTIRDVGSFSGLEWTLEHKRRSEAGRITAPRIVAYSLFPQIEAVNTPDRAREWVRQVREKGADGVKFILDPQIRDKWKTPLAGRVVSISLEVHKAVIDEARKLGMPIAVHHGCTQDINPLDSARMGITSIEHDVGCEHEFGIPGALGYTADKTDTNGLHKRPLRPDWVTGEVPPKWHHVIAELISRDVTLVPTYAVLEARRDFMRASRAEWHDEYTMPYLAKAFLPNPRIHGSGYLDWTTEEEIRWQKAFKGSMRFIKDFCRAGGRVAAGSDAGFIYLLYGFGFIRELEMLQEAGLSAMEAIQAATKNGAELLRMSSEIGTVEVGKKADLILVPENPLDNLKVLYGTGHLRYNDKADQLERIGGVQYTIKDGIVWNAKELLRDVRELVDIEKANWERRGKSC